MLALLCGIPGSGKSSLAREIKLRFDHWESITFDDFEMKQEAWNEHSYIISRNQALVHVASAVIDSKNSTPKQKVLIVDDTMHLRSMRHDVYKVCRDSCIPMLVIWVNTDADIAVTRNDSREPEKRVPTSSFQKIVESFQEAITTHVCDRYMVEVKNYGVHPAQDESAVQEIVNTISAVLNDPTKYLPPSSLTASSQQIFITERLELNPNEKKLLDEYLRNAISQIIKAAREVDIRLAKVLGPKLAACKAESLQTLSITSAPVEFANVVNNHCSELPLEQQAMIAEIVKRSLL